MNIITKWWVSNAQNHPSRGILTKRCSENMQQFCRRTPMPKCDFNKVASQLYWDHTSVWVFSCKFAAYWNHTSAWKQTSIIAKVHPVTVGHRYVDHQAKSFKIRIYRFTWCLALLRIVSPLLKKTTNSEGLEYIFLIINWPLISLNDITIPTSWQLSVFRRYIKWEHWLKIGLRE